MKNGMILAVVLAALCTRGETVKTATQPWVRSYVATNHTDVTGKADKTNTYTKAETDSAMGYFARTNSVLKNGPYVQKTSTSVGGQNMYGGFRIYGWLDATGTVAAVRIGPSLLEMRSPSAWMDYSSFNLGWGTGGWTFDSEGFHRHLHGAVFEPFTNGPAIKLPEDAWETGGTLALRSDISAMSSAFLPRQYGEEGDSASVGFDYGPGGMAFVPSEIYSQRAYFVNFYLVTDDERGPLSAIGQYSVSGKTARQEVEETIREKSLGGIWDQELEVWWTPIMENGALRYCATTNVNLEVNQ